MARTRPFDSNLSLPDGLPHSSAAWRYLGLAEKRPLAALLVGGLLLVAAVFKLYAMVEGWAEVASHGLPFGMVSFVIVAEGVIGTALILGMVPRWTRPATLTLFSGFACYSLATAFHGSASCGCFGRLVVSPWLMVGIDVVTIALLSAWRPGSMAISRGDTENVWLGTSRLDWQRDFVTCIIPCLAVGATAGWVVGQERGSTGSGQLYIAQPEQWVGQELPLAANIDIGSELLEGEWTILFYHHDCPKCQEAVTEYERLATEKAGAQRRIALVELPPYELAETGYLSALVHGKLDQSRDWFVETPLHVTVSGGIVRAFSHEDVYAVMTSGAGALQADYLVSNDSPADNLQRLLESGRR